MFISLDLETTGFDPGKDQIIEFGAVKFDLKGNQIDTLQMLFNPGFNLPPIIKHITGISDEDVKNAPQFPEKSKELQEFIGDLPIVGHNIQFDTNFLKANGLELENAEYDTMEFTGILFPQLNSYSLEILSEYFQLLHEDKHRALDDAMASMELFLKLISHFQSLEPELIQTIQSLCNKSDWQLKTLISELRPDKSKKPINLHLPKPETHVTSIDPQKIISQKNSSLFEITDSYNKLALDLAQEAKEGTLIALPYHLFKDISQEAYESITKFDLPQNYISEKRLEQFIKQENLETYELISLVKYLIWIKETKTGLLSEINLFREEQKTISKICALKEDDPFPQKALKENKLSPAICSHEYLNKTRPGTKNLIILDFDKYTKSLFWSLSKQLTLLELISPLLDIQKISTKTESIETLISKSTILFGVIGILFEKSKNQDIYRPKGFISNLEIASPEWQQITQIITNLITISKALGPLNNDLTSPYLQAWKANLQTLYEIFFNVDLEETLIWTELDFNEQANIKKTPKSIKKTLTEILANFETFQIIGDGLDVEDNGAFIKNLYAIPENIPLHKTKLEIPPEIFIAEDSPEYDRSETQLAKFLKEYLIKDSSPKALILNSRKLIEIYTSHLSQPLKDANFSFLAQLSGSVNKLSEILAQHPDNSVIALTGFAWQHLQNSHIPETLIIHKVPFDPPSDPYLMAISQDFNNPFIELQIPLAILNLKRIITHSKAKRIIILDPRIVNKDYGELIIKTLNSFAQVQILPLTRLLSLQNL